MHDRVVVITGASAGIGEALAREVGRRGGRPVLAARRAKELAEAAALSGKQALAVTADVTRREDSRRILDAAIERFGGVDVWVNNAGRGITRPVSLLTDDDIDQMMLVNVKSALYGIQTALPHFVERGRGHIINVSSMLGRVPFAHFRSAYGAAKHALNSLTANLRVELAGQHPGIHVTCVMPGVVATEFGTNSLHGGPDSRRLPGAQAADEVAAAIADAIESPRAEVYTRPEHQVLAAAYYASEDVAQLERQAPFVMPGR